MDSATLNTISLFSGVGMLDEGVHAGFEFLGIRSRTVVFAEREAYPVSVLAARMEEGSIPPAPIWFGDLCELPAKEFYGKVDCVVAGFPCQDLSVAGRRAGLDGKRSGLFFEVTRIATDSGAWLIVLENVAGIASATATVMDEEEGELEERAAARVVGELADLGWNAEWIVVSASDVGASHGRARWFCLAWRVDDAERAKRRQTCSSRASGEQGHDCGRSETHGRIGIAEQVLGNVGLQYGFLQQREIRTEYSTAIFNLDDSNSDGAQRPRGAQFSTDAGREVLGNAASDGWRQGRPDSGGPSLPVADASSAGRQRNELGRACDGNRGGQKTHGSISQLCGLFSPGPSDPRWSDIIDQFSEVAPALEPTFRKLVNGMAFDMDDSRAARLKCSGNGVVALSAAVAVVVLARRAGIFEAIANHEQLKERKAA